MNERLDLYRRIDALLADRSRDYPRRREPTWGDLMHALDEATDELRRGARRRPTPEASRAAAAVMDGPVFVVGYYKSGTTLVLGLLDAHPELTVLPSEGRHFGTVRPRLAGRSRPEQVALLQREWLQRLITPTGLPPFWTLGLPWEVGNDPYARFVEYLDALADGHPDAELLGVVAGSLLAVQVDTKAMAASRLWVEKTPKQELLVDEILALYPRARFVHVVRDPLSVAAALRDFDGSAPIVDPRTAAVELARSFECAASRPRMLGNDRYLVVRYERLVADTEGEMRRVAAFLDIAFDESLLRPTVGGLPLTANSSRAERREVGRVHTLSRDRREELDRRSRALVCALAGPAARGVGYDLPQGKLRVAIAARARLRARHTWAGIGRG